MLYVFPAIAALVIIILQRRLRSLQSFFILGILFSWVLAFSGVIAYLAARSDYFYIQRVLLSTNLRLALTLQQVFPNPFLANRFLNLGVFGFYFSLTCFTRSMAKPGTTSAREYSIVAVCYCLLIVIFDPGGFRFFYNLAFSSTTSSIVFRRFYSAVAVFEMAVRIVVIGTAGLTVIQLWLSFVRRRLPRFLHNYMLLVGISVTGMTGIFVILFSQLPAVLINVSAAAGTFSFLPMHTGVLAGPTYVLGHATVLILVLIIIATAIRHHIFGFYFRRNDVHIFRRLAAVNPVVTVITHTLKNHLLAIDYELSRVSTTNEQPVKRIRQITSELSAQLRVLNDGFRPFHIDLQLVSLANHLGLQVVQLRKCFPTAKISFFVESPSPTVYLDHEKFAVAIENIVRNGIEATRDTITPKLMIRLQRVEDVAVVLITDNGTGMDHETRERVFEPFCSTKSAKTNWGVGLNIAYRIIHGHDGSVAIRSSSTNGTTVEVSLPAIGIDHD